MVAKELVLIVILAAIVFVFINIQPTHAPKECSSCIQFKKITQDLEKNLKNVVRDPPLKPEVPIRKLLDNYTQIYEGLFANNNFLEELFNRENEYKQSVSTLLEDLESIKQEKNEIMGELSNLTSTFVRDVVKIASQTEPNDNDDKQGQSEICRENNNSKCSTTITTSPNNTKLDEPTFGEKFMMGLKKSGDVPLFITYTNNSNETVSVTSDSIKQFVMELVGSGKVLTTEEKNKQNTGRELVDVLQTIFRNYDTLKDNPELKTKMDIVLIQYMDLMSDVETGQELMNQLNSNNIQRVHDGNGSTIIKITIKDGTTGNSSDYFIHDVKTLDKEPDFKKIIIGTTTQDGSESIEQCKASSGTPSKSVSHCGAMGLMQ